jgi:hypothetical protein
MHHGQAKRADKAWPSLRIHQHQAEQWILGPDGARSGSLDPAKLRYQRAEQAFDRVRFAARRLEQYQDPATECVSTRLRYTRCDFESPFQLLSEVGTLKQLVDVPALAAWNGRTKANSHASPFTFSRQYRCEASGTGTIIMTGDGDSLSCHMGLSTYCVVRGLAALPLTPFHRLLVLDLRLQVLHVLGQPNLRAPDLVARFLTDLNCLLQDDPSLPLAQTADHDAKYERYEELETQSSSP